MAYSRYQYETSPRKIQEPRPEKRKTKTVKKNKKNNKVNKKEQKKIQTKWVMYVLIGFSILFAISYRNSLINESFSKIKKLKANLATIEKENEQLQVNIEDSLNLKTIEQSAQELLGMQKLENSQKVYVNLPKEDYIEPATEEIVTQEKEQNIFSKIIKFLFGE